MKDTIWLSGFCDNLPYTLDMAAVYLDEVA